MLGDRRAGGKIEGEFLRQRQFEDAVVFFEFGYIQRRHAAIGPRHGQLVDIFLPARGIFEFQHPVALPRRSGKLRRRAGDLSERKGLNVLP